MALEAFVTSSWSKLFSVEVCSADRIKSRRSFRYVSRCFSYTYPKDLGFRFPFVWLHVTCMVIFGFNNGNHIHVSCYRLLARFRFAAPVHNISTSKVSFYGKYIHPRVLPPWLLTSNWFVLMKTKYPNICERKLTLYLSVCDLVHANLPLTYLYYTCRTCI